MKKDDFNEIAPPEEYESDIRYMMHIAHGIEFNPISDYASAKKAENGCVVFEGDYGGEIYLTCPMKYVICPHETLVKLAHDIDKMFWNDKTGCRVFYEAYDIGDGVSGGMGGGEVIDDLWVHADLKEKELFDKVYAVISGTKSSIQI